MPSVYIWHFYFTLVYITLSLSPFSGLLLPSLLLSLSLSILMASLSSTAAGDKSQSANTSIPAAEVTISEHHHPTTGECVCVCVCACACTFVCDNLSVMSVVVIKTLFISQLSRPPCLSYFVSNCLNKSVLTTPRLESSFSMTRQAVDCAASRRHVRTTLRT